MYYGASSLTFERARMLRGSMTEAEKLLWNQLRGRSTGYKFRRQHPIRSYIVDFYCHSLKLVIEVDGDVHQEITNIAYDQGRTAFLEDQGITVIRFTNHEVGNHSRGWGGSGR